MVPVPQADATALAHEIYLFNTKQLSFLKEFQKDCDFSAAGKRAGYGRRQLTKFTDPTTPLGQAMLREMENIQKTWMDAIHLNAASAAAKHIKLMSKFEADYDTAEMKNQNKGSLASTLAKMSDSSLKATGQFSNGEKNTGTKVEINIDLSSNEKPPPIEVKEADDEHSS